MMNLDVPEVLGVMVLPGGILFPGAMLPLYIFESQYRKMLAKALATHRIFGVGAPDPEQEGVSPIGGAGFIRACVANPDGTSHLVLQGFSRIRFLEWSFEHPYPEAKIEAVGSWVSSPDEAAALRRKAEHLCEKLAVEGRDLPSNFLEAMKRTSDLAEFSDLATAVVSDIGVRQELLEETDVVFRLKILVKYLEKNQGPSGN